MLGAKGGFRLATRDAETIGRWWGRDAGANIGVPCGKASGFFVIDIDPRNGGDVSWQALLDQHGADAAELGALVQRTGGGGQHYLFAWDERVRKGKLAEGIDVKREGGYIVAEPSVTQARYAFDDWDVGSGDLPPLGPAPAWLLGLVSVPAETPAQLGAVSGPWDADLPKLRSALALLQADD
jgi:hypothetical protein